MGFTIYYRSTRPVGDERADAIRKAAEVLNEGRTWLSCEPVDFFLDRGNGRLRGGSKPNFLPNPEHAAAAAREPLPDGTVRDMIDILCQLSRDHGVDWEFSHDYDPGPIGFIRGGVCEPGLLEQMEALADLPSILSELGGFELKRMAWACSHLKLARGIGMIPITTTKMTVPRSFLSGRRTIRPRYPVAAARCPASI